MIGEVIGQHAEGRFMQLRLNFELDASLWQPHGEALIDIDLAAERGKAVVSVRDIKAVTGSALMHATSKMFSEPLCEILATELSDAINQAIAQLTWKDQRTIRLWCVSSI